MAVPLSLANLTNPPTALEWFAAAIANAATLGLPTTTWQPGSIERDIFVDVSLLMQQSDVETAIMVQAGFLSFAASGFVTYTDADGVLQTLFVTPDPSIPAQNPTGALGWLDVLANEVYDVQRILSSAAGGAEAILNTSATTYGPYAIGTFHIAVANGPTYSNTASLTIPPSVVVETVTGVANSAGLIEVTTSGAHGLTTGDIVAIAGVSGVPPLTGTTAWVVTVTGSDTFTLDGSTFSDSYVSGGTVYTPTLGGFTADSAGTQGNADPEAVNVMVTSLIGVSGANYAEWIGSDTEGNEALAARCKLKLAAIAVGTPGGALTFYALTAKQLAPTLTPPSALASAVTRARVDLDTLTGTAYVTIANANGAPISDDVTAVQAVEDAFAPITSFTIVVRAAVESTATIVLEVFLPAAYNTTTNHDLFVSAVEDYVRAVQIAGLTLTGGTSPDTNVLPYDSILGAVFVAARAASIPLKDGDVQGTLDGGTANKALALSPIPEVAVPDVTITLTSV